MKLKGNISKLLVLGAILVLSGIAIFISLRLFQLRGENVAPNAPESQPAAASLVDLTCQVTYFDFAFACNDLCTTDSQCQVLGPEYSCATIAGEGRCRLTENTSSVTCEPLVPVSPSPTVSAFPSIPPGSGQCIEVRVYDLDWNQLTLDQIKELQPGDDIYITVIGGATLGRISSGRFVINGGDPIESSDLKPDSIVEEYYILYTIPEGATGLSVQGDVFYDQLDVGF